MDIRELARCFTGWELRRGSFHFNRVLHDVDEKTLFGMRRVWSGSEAIDHVLAQHSAAAFLAAKLLRYYVSDDPRTCEEFAEPLAVLVRQHDFHLAPVLRTLFMSRLFYSSLAHGSKIRSPIDLAIGTSRALSTTASTTGLARMLRPLGQELFRPPSVKGWDGGKRWINSTTLIGRANLIWFVANDAVSRFDGQPIADWNSRLPGDPKSRVDQFLQLLVAIDVPQDVRSSLYDLASDSPAADVLHAISMLPEFHLASRRHDRNRWRRPAPSQAQGAGELGADPGSLLTTTRRQLLVSSAASATLISNFTLSCPRFLLQAAAASPKGKEKRILVVVQLTGGNDGLNTIIPVGDDVYHRSRFQTRIRQGIRIDDYLHFHPSLTGLAELLDRGNWPSFRVSVIPTQIDLTSNPWTSGTRPAWALRADRPDGLVVASTFESGLARQFQQRAAFISAAKLSRWP